MNQAEERKSQVTEQYALLTIAEVASELRV